MSLYDAAHVSTMTNLSMSRVYWGSGTQVFFFNKCVLLSLFCRLHNATLIFASIFPLSSFGVKCPHPAPPPNPPS